ncbi:Serine aminopeptidase, S33 [Parapedobacter composti]|uniref:Serine aminopeptidase, S33 n=2 Tax=Parapedobacter composti TaxID=623281 RepID=A0A1I1E5B3_9SPHI|nr:Serine aminopeptidase, S33 [Parapedobacter composti]
MLVGVVFCIIMPQVLYSQGQIERRKKYLEESLQINIKQRFRANTRRISVQDSTWDDWLRRTGELPPDFSAMPSTPMLPDPLLYNREGRTFRITTQAQWDEQREWIKAQYQEWIAGHAPPAPGNVEPEILKDTVEAGGARVQLIKLKFGPKQQATMTLELIVPEGSGPFPVFMTQWNHRGWAQLAVKRGYIGCVYAAADVKDDTDYYQARYPDYDFSGLMRRAWGASRVVDYLFTRPEVNNEQIAITGHSRNGKQSLWAAAFDERIAAVISSSSSTGGDMPWRYCDPQYASETLDYVAAWNGHWFHPRLRFFAGREDKLPVDQNSLAALVAPRPLLFHYSIVEQGLNSWSNEQNYYSVKKVYEFLGVPDRIGVHTRMGEHAVAARDVEATIDFLDIQFKRIDLEWTNRLYYTYNYERWEAQHEEERAEAARINKVSLNGHYTDLNDFKKERAQIVANLHWLLGEEPSGVRAADVVVQPKPRYDWVESVVPRPVVPGAKALYLGPYTAIGDHISGVLYCPVNQSGSIKLPPSGKLPVIIYAHQYAYSTGFSKGYDKDGRRGTTRLFEALVKQGFAVLAIDMYGFGTRIEEATHFYQRYPKWSKMGKMVRDIRSCIDAVEDLDFVDEKHVYLLGNTIGGSVSLFAAVLDKRVAGVATVAAFSPWRTSNSQYESLRTYSHLHGFIPKLGFFADSPSDVPVDFGELLAAVAPTPILIIAPDIDRHTDIEALKRAMVPVSQVYDLYGKQEHLIVDYPHEINRLTTEMFPEIGVFFRSLYNGNLPDVVKHRSIK